MVRAVWHPKDMTHISEIGKRWKAMPRGQRIASYILVPVLLLGTGGFMFFQASQEAAQARTTYAAFSTEATATVTAVTVGGRVTKQSSSISLSVPIADGDPLQCSIDGNYLPTLPAVGDAMTIRYSPDGHCASIQEIDTRTSLAHYLPLVGGLFA